MERKQRALPELSHVGEQRHINLLCEIPELLQALQRFGKDRVGASSDIFPRALHCLIETFYRARVRSRDDHEVRIAPRTCGGFDFTNHLIDSDNRFPCEMSATLWKFLVLDVATGQACAFQLANCPRHILCATKTRVCVDNRWNLDSFRNVTGQLSHFR